MDNDPAARVRGLDSSLAIATSSSDENTSNSNFTDKIIIEDWSKTGRGSHVDFERDEKVPLDPGTYTPASPRTYQLTIKSAGSVEVRWVMCTKSKLMA